MNRLRLLLARVRGRVQEAEPERDLQEEIAAHLDEATEEYVRRGLTPADARQELLRSFGGVTQVREVHRELRSFGWLDEIGRDLHYACRSLTRTPGFAAVAIATLALAIGTATALFSVIDAA